LLLSYDLLVALIVATTSSVSPTFVSFVLLVYLLHYSGIY